VTYDRGYLDVTGVLGNATWGLAEARLQVRILLSQNYPSVRETFYTLKNLLNNCFKP
jgi:hypothetical protein